MSSIEVVEPERHPRYANYLARYRSGTWRDRILHDLILEDADLLCRPCTFLDIGCGRGFDDDLPLQVSLSRHAAHYIGIEPDPHVNFGSHFTETHRCMLEDAPIANATIEIAFAVMVLEHLAEPQRFWDKIYDLLVPGGLFWGLTIDSRHPFASLSLWSEWWQIKDIYMRMLMGKRGEERYLNYPVHYRSNSPAQINMLSKRFKTCQLINFSRVGQIETLFPSFMRPAVLAYDKWSVARGKPGTLLAIRAEK